MENEEKQYKECETYEAFAIHHLSKQVQNSQLTGLGI